MNRPVVLWADAAINLMLGVLLLLFYPKMAQVLGVPWEEQRFYPTVLGAVLVGIGIALLIECFGRQGAFVGLGLGGAVAINLCAAIAIAIWLSAGPLELPLRGKLLLWGLVVLLVVISAVEIHTHSKKSAGKTVGCPQDNRRVNGRS